MRWPGPTTILTGQPQADQSFEVDGRLETSRIVAFAEHGNAQHQSSSAATVAAALMSAFIPGYGLLLLIPALVAGVPAVLMLSRDITRG